MSKFRQVQAQGASGASLFINIPAEFVKNMDIEEGDYLKISIINSKLVMEQVDEK